MTAYQHWQTPLSLESVFSKPSSPSYLSVKNGALYWLESLTTEGGRTVLKQRLADGSIRQITPSGYSIRTKANEYGGRAYILANEHVFFCNQADQRLYCQPLSGNQRPQALTKNRVAGHRQYFADLCLSPNERFLFFVMETENEAENDTEIAYIETAKINQEPRILCQGADFYASLSLSNSGQQLAWIQWNHPNMPWDDTLCQLADVEYHESEIVLGETQCVVEHATAAHTGFHLDDRLLLTIDWRNQSPMSAKNYANVYQWQKAQGCLQAVTQETVEYSYPHWIFGNMRYASVDESTLIAIATTPAGDELHRINLVNGDITRIAENYCVFDSICSENGCVYVLAASATQPLQILAISSAESVQTMHAAAASLDEAMISCAELLQFNASDGGVVYANYYPPCNPHYQQPDSAPPLIVMVHGGPTASANSGFDLFKQLWTTSGFAILDVNHRGSSGFGRQYRDALREQWGVLDAQDIHDAVLFAIEQGLAAPEAVFIRGKSAGGYAVQRVLTEFPQVFCAGASYYGIGDLATLAQITHKFESHYTDNLLGEVYQADKAKQPESRYFQRSPIHFMHRIQCPMILFQGMEDKVVPPTLAEEVVSVLTAQNIRYEYHQYDGEGHGFRSQQALQDSFQREMAFFRSWIE